ncbi:hypothetical protein LAZ67_3005785 [Cordylochernes scorpioides]|uniref:Uncharacterized protein n=1 Tax=Cordylochernes scorpioides TaxID=51811 RepID=A0ABY6KDL2_9ARAC|nr:hypothetical protein LAZ67_3005785 [Cordylochernes scorpioides]
MAFNLDEVKKLSQQWKLLHDNAPAHKATLVMDYLANHLVTVLSHPPYSPDLFPCDYSIFHSSNLTARVVPMVLVLEVNGKPTASESRAPVGPVQKATVATQTSAPSQRSTEVQTPKRPKLKLATKTQNWAANLIPAETQTWRILTPAETQTLPVLNQAETWPNSFASSTEPGSWPNLTESQSWSNPAAGTQTWPNQKPLDSQTWPNMTSEETRPLQNLIPAETQTMERFTPIPPQTLQGLTPRAAQSLQDLISAQTQSLQDLITSTRENIRDLIATQAQVLQNLIPEKDHIEWQSLCEQGSDPWLASIHTQTPGPLPAQTQTSWEEDALAAGLLVDDNPLPFLGEEDFITLMDTETQTAPDLSHSACQTLEELFPNI